MFCMHVGQVCGSIYVMKLNVKAGPAGKEALTTVICDIVDVEFAWTHMELVEANEEYSNQCNHVRVRSKTFCQARREIKRSSKTLRIASYGCIG